MKQQVIYLQHTLQCIERIEEYTRQWRDAFFSSHLIQDATLRNLQTMAESTQRLSEEMKARRSEVDWQALSGFRNVLAHDYLGIDLELVYTSIEVNLPGLHIAIEALLNETRPEA